MNNQNYNSVDPETGTIIYNGPSELTKGNHTNMPHRTESYLPTDERGHIQASSLGGSNSRENIVPQSADLNHMDETIWIPQKPDHPVNGYETCKLCGGTGHLENLYMKWPDNYIDYYCHCCKKGDCTIE